MRNLGRLTFLLVNLAFVSFLCGQNSTKKNRIQPNALSNKVGSAVKWQPSLAAAKELSAKTGKPVFWYISTMPGTFMDRKPVIDRYMRGGPFSWPPIIQMLNDQFVPVKVIPREQDREMGIRPYKFVEPGFVILSPKGKVVFKLDQLTTLHYGWLENLLAKQIRTFNPDFKKPESPKYFAEFSGTPDKWIDPFGEDFEKTPANLLLSGMIAFRKGDHQLAKQRWTSAASSDPDHPLAWKASLEAQGIGPFSRGFEVFRSIPDAALLAGTKSKGSAAPANAFSRAQLVARSTNFLLGMQRQDGAFVDSDYDFGGFDSLPNVHVAVSSLAGMALLKVYAAQSDNRDEIEQAILKIETFVTNEENINPADRDEILWAHSYRLRFLSRLGAIKSLKAKIDNYDKKRQSAIKALENIQLKTGNWYHEYNNPFVTATALVALHEAKLAGGTLDSEKIDKGLESLLQDRTSKGAYPYYSARRKRTRSDDEQRQMLLASAGRMPLCELALVVWDKKNQENLIAAVANSLENHKHLASGYKYDNHTSNMAYGGFFFWYDMRSRSEAIRGIENPKVREAFRKKHQALVNSLPEVDGCFVDSHELGRVYGTAMALLSMD